MERLANKQNLLVKCSKLDWEIKSSQLRYDLLILHYLCEH